MGSDERQTPEFTALQQILKGEEIDLHAIDFSHFIQLVHDHRLISPVYLSYTKEDALKTRLDADYLTNKLHQLKLIAELREIASVFKEINWLLLKGPVLSQLIYNDPGDRTSKDLDILIHSTDFDKAVSLLKDHGYQLRTFFRSPKQRRALLKHLHDVEFLTPSGEAIVEMHWKLFNIEDSFLNTDSLFHKSAPIKLGDDDFRTLSMEDRIVYLCIHGINHGFYRLQWLYDIYRLYNSHPGTFRELITKHEDKKEIVRPLVSSLMLCEKAFGLHSNELERFRSKKEYSKLVRYCWQEIIDNDSFISPRTYGGIRRTWRNHRLNYLIGGWRQFWKGIFARNVRPENWKVFAFPDKVFFLNHVFSRMIWLYGKISGKL